MRNLFTKQIKINKGRRQHSDAGWTSSEGWFVRPDTRVLVGATQHSDQVNELFLVHKRETDHMRKAKRQPRARSPAGGRNWADKLLRCHSDGLLRAALMVFSAPFRWLAPSPLTPPSAPSDGSLRRPALSLSYGLLKSTRRPGAGSHEA
jgi:hypothetical protein